MGRKKPHAMKTINEENTGETKTVIEKPGVEESKKLTNGSVRKDNAAEKEEAEQIIKKISVHEAYDLILQNKDNENFMIREVYDMIGGTTKWQEVELQAVK